jgi:two-component system sensor histidine kinase RpfC
LSSQTQRERLKALIAVAPRSEAQQAALRLLIGGLVLVYVAWAVLRGGPVGPEEKEVLAVTAGFVGFSVLVTLTIIANPGVSALRRFVAMAVDNAVTTYCVIQMGERGAVVLFVYLFLIFGNGFRFGRLYLHACQSMAIVGFAFVLVLSPFWSQHPAIGFGYLIGLIVLPIYVGSLAERIKTERVKAEEALKACIERERRLPSG